MTSAPITEATPDIRQPSRSAGDSSGMLVRLSGLLVLIVLAVCEFLWFGPIIGKIGFYMDDWFTYSNLSTSAQDWGSLVKTCFSDPRLIPRPVEGYFFVISWLLCGAQPIGHHVLNCIFEVLSSWFVYLSVARVTNQRSTAFLAALLLLICPVHDSTHYWATTNSISLSLALCTFSMLEAITAVQERKLLPLLLSYTAFLASLFNYEAFTPLCLVTALCVFYISARNHLSAASTKTRTGLLRAARQTILVCVPYGLAIVAYLLYQRAVLNGMGYQHPLTFDIGRVLEVYRAGWDSTVGPAALEFLNYRAKEGLSGPLGHIQRINLVILCVVSAITTIGLGLTDRKKVNPWCLPVMGIAAFLAAYSIYSLSNDYTPVLTTIGNRINYGGSIGISLFLAGAIGVATSFIKRRLPQVLVIAVLSLPLITFCTMADWGFSKPWMMAWDFQKQVIDLVRTQAAHLKPGDTVLLANTPRYVFWSPVFNGAWWDFRSMLRQENHSVQVDGDVVTERLVVKRDGISSIDTNALYGRYQYKQLFVLTPSAKQLIPINSKREFLRVMTKYRELGVPDSTLAEWKKQK